MFLPTCITCCWIRKKNESPVSFFFFLMKDSLFLLFVLCKFVVFTFQKLNKKIYLKIKERKNVAQVVPDRITAVAPTFVEEGYTYFLSFFG